MRTMLWIALGVPVALALFIPDLAPQLEFDSIPLISSNALYSILVAAIVLLPFAVALVCSAGSRTDREREIARGIALGGGGLAVVVLSLLALVALYGLAWGGSGSGLWTMRLFACLLLIVIHAALAWTAVRGSVLTGISGLALVCVTGYAMLALFIFLGGDQLAQRKGRAYRDRMDADSSAAESAVRSVALCAIGYRAADPTREIPGDLESLVRAAGCNTQLLDPRATPEYTLTFSARSRPLSASDTSCMVVANFTGHRLQDGRGGRFSDGRTITGDCLGVIREREQRYANRGGDSVVGPGPYSALSSLSLDLERFAREAPGHYYPARLADLRDKYLAETQGAYMGIDYAKQSPADVDNNQARWDPRILRYIPDRAGGVATAPVVNFQISARCASYGPQCIRSYLADRQGFVHGTGQDRDALDSDPIIQSCELQAPSNSCDGQPARSIRRAVH
jgi:hypothetical protein